MTRMIQPGFAGVSLLFLAIASLAAYARPARDGRRSHCSTSIRIGRSRTSRYNASPVEVFPMKRSGSVTASAIISIIGSLGTLVLGLALVVSAIFARSNPQLRAGAGSAPIDVTIVLLVEGGVLFAFGVFGIVSAIGLLKLRNWARVC